jgi:hypothetical protein
MSEKPSGPGRSPRPLAPASNRHGSHNTTGHGRVHAQCRADLSASVSSVRRNTADHQTGTDLIPDHPYNADSLRLQGRA